MGARVELPLLPNFRKALSVHGSSALEPDHVEDPKAPREANQEYQRPTTQLNLSMRAVICFPLGEQLHQAVKKEEKADRGYEFHVSCSRPCSAIFSRAS